MRWVCFSYCLEQKTYNCFGENGEQLNSYLMNTLSFYSVLQAVALGIDIELSFASQGTMRIHCHTPNAKQRISLQLV